jgi:acetylornithine aminotransferase
MSFRLPARRLAAAAGRRYLSASSPAAAGSNLSQQIKQAIAHDASVPNPDPAEDSASAAMINEHAKYMLATYARPPPVFVRGEGSYLYDLENRKYLDFTSGIAVNSLGHCDPGVWHVIADQVSIRSLFPLQERQCLAGQRLTPTRPRH